MIFAHGFGCDQHMWRLVAPAFEADFRVILFDHVGAGGSELAVYDVDRYSTLDGYAEDVLEICRELDFGKRAASVMREMRALRLAPSSRSLRTKRERMAVC